MRALLQHAAHAAPDLQLGAFGVDLRNVDPGSGRDHVVHAPDRHPRRAGVRASGSGRSELCPEHFADVEGGLGFGLARRAGRDRDAVGDVVQRQVPPEQGGEARERLDREDAAAFAHARAPQQRHGPHMRADVEERAARTAGARPARGACRVSRTPPSDIAARSRRSSAGSRR